MQFMQSILIYHNYLGVKLNENALDIYGRSITQHFWQSGTMKSYRTKSNITVV